jgi:hypothetical protein
VNDTGGVATIVSPRRDERTLVDVWAWQDETVMLWRRAVHPRRGVAHDVLAFARSGTVHAVQRAVDARPTPAPELAGVLDGPVAEDVGDAGAGLHGWLRWRPAPGGRPSEPIIELDRGHEWWLDRPATSLGTVEGCLRVDDATIDIDGWTAIGEERRGVAPVDLPPGPLDRPWTVLPQRLWLRALLARPHGPETLTYACDASGRTELLAGWTSTSGSTGVHDDEVVLHWWPGTRRLRWAELADPAGGGRMCLEAVTAVPAAAVGGLGSPWPLAGWVGADAVRRLRRRTGGGAADGTAAGGGLDAVSHHVLAEAVGVSGRCRAVVEITALGAHDPSGLSGWTAGA